MKLVRESLNFKEKSDPIHDMGIGVTLKQELEKDDFNLTDEHHFVFDNENEAYWYGNLLHPMSGYGDSFDYLDLTVTLTKEGQKRYIVKQEGENRHGEIPPYAVELIEDGELYIDEYNVDEFDYEVGYEINQRDEFETLMAAVEFILNDALEYEG